MVSRIGEAVTDFFWDADEDHKVFYLLVFADEKFQKVVALNRGAHLSCAAAR